MTLKNLQLNLNHFPAVHDLLLQIVREENIEVVLPADQYRNLDGPASTGDGRGLATIWDYEKHPFQENMEIPKHCFVMATMTLLHLLYATQHVAGGLPGCYTRNRDDSLCE